MTDRCGGSEQQTGGGGGGGEEEEECTATRAEATVWKVGDRGCSWFPHPYSIAPPTISPVEIALRENRGYIESVKDNYYCTVELVIVWTK